MRVEDLGDGVVTALRCHHVVGDRLFTGTEWRELLVKQDLPPSRVEDSPKSQEKS